MHLRKGCQNVSNASGKSVVPHVRIGLVVSRHAHQYSPETLLSASIRHMPSAFFACRTICFSIFLLYFRINMSQSLRSTTYIFPHSLFTYSLNPKYEFSHTLIPFKHKQTHTFKHTHTHISINLQASLLLLSNVVTL